LAARLRKSEPTAPSGCPPLAAAVLPPLPRTAVSGLKRSVHRTASELVENARGETASARLGRGPSLRRGTPPIQLPSAIPRSPCAGDGSRKQRFQLSGQIVDRIANDADGPCLQRLGRDTLDEVDGGSETARILEGARTGYQETLAVKHRTIHVCPAGHGCRFHVVLLPREPIATRPYSGICPKPLYILYCRHPPL